MQEFWAEPHETAKPYASYQAGYQLSMPLEQIYLIRKLLLDPCHAGTEQEELYKKANTMIVETWYQDRTEDESGKVVFPVALMPAIVRIIKKASLAYIRRTLRLSSDEIFTNEMLAKIASLSEDKKTEYMTIYTDVLIPFTAIEFFFYGMIELEDLIENTMPQEDEEGED